MNLLDAAYNVVHDYPGGTASLAPRLGRLPASMCHELTATNGSKLGLLDAQKITQLTGDLRILQAFATNCGQMLVSLPDLADVGSANTDCMERLSESVTSFGALCQEVASDLKDERISDNELHRIDRDCGGLIATVNALREALARRNLDAKPAHLKVAS